MSFLFHPHVHGRRLVTTPDILIDRIRRGAGAPETVFGAEGLSSVTQWSTTRTKTRTTKGSTKGTTKGSTAGTIQDAGWIAACVLVAARGSPLLAVGWDGGAGRTIIGREAWRFSDLVDHVDQLRLRLLLPAGAMVQTAEQPLPPLPPPDLPRGSAVFCGNDQLRLNDTDFAWCEAEIHDPVLGRSIRHRLWLQEID